MEYGRRKISLAESPAFESTNLLEDVRLQLLSHGVKETEDPDYDPRKPSRQKRIKRARTKSRNTSKQGTIEKVNASKRPRKVSFQRFNSCPPRVTSNKRPRYYAEAIDDEVEFISFVKKTHSTTPEDVCDSEREARTTEVVKDTGKAYEPNFHYLRPEIDGESNRTLSDSTLLDEELETNSFCNSVDSAEGNSHVNSSSPLTRSSEDKLRHQQSCASRGSKVNKRNSEEMHLSAPEDSGFPPNKARFEKHFLCRSRVRDVRKGKLQKRSTTRKLGMEFDTLNRSGKLEEHLREQERLYLDLSNEARHRSLSRRSETEPRKEAFVETRDAIETSETERGTSNDLTDSMRNLRLYTSSTLSLIEEDAEKGVVTPSCSHDLQKVPRNLVEGFQDVEPCHSLSNAKLDSNNCPRSCKESGASPDMREKAKQLDKLSPATNGEADPFGGDDLRVSVSKSKPEVTAETHDFHSSAELDPSVVPLSSSLRKSDKDHVPAEDTEQSFEILGGARRSGRKRRKSARLRKKREAKQQMQCEVIDLTTILDDGSEDEATEVSKAPSPSVKALREHAPPPRRMQELGVLNSDELSLVKAITMGARNRDEVIVTIEEENISLTRNDFKRLRGARWLNDEIINAYVALINKRNRLHFIFEDGKSPKHEQMRTRPRTFVFNSYFYTRLTSGGYDFPGVRRWTRKANIDILQMNLILFPVNLGNAHWILTGVDMDNRKFLYLDSMHGRDHSNVVQNLRQWLYDEINDKHGRLVAEEWKVADFECILNRYITYSEARGRGRLVPRQTDSGSCGVFSSKYADYLERGEAIQFRQDQIPLLRSRMALDLFYQEILT